MVNRNKILSDLSKFASDAMGAFSGIKDEIETIVSLRVDKAIKKMNLVRKDEFDILKKMVQKLIEQNEVQKKSRKNNTLRSKKSVKKANIKKKIQKKTLIT